MYMIYLLVVSRIINYLLELILEIVRIICHTFIDHTVT